MIRWVAGFSIAMAVGYQAPALEESETYDLWIKGGTVVDGTGEEPYVADVVIAGDTIVYIGDVDFDLHAATTVDVTDKEVTPGFVDVHAHGDPLSNPLDNFVAQGVTTVVLG